MKQTGFSMVELLVVVAIIGIIATVALPSYESYVKRSYRSDAMAELSTIMTAQETYAANEMTYTTNLTHLNYTASPATRSGKYNISASTCGEDPISACVKLTATPQGSQASDGTITLDSRGNKTHGTQTSWLK